LPTVISVDRGDRKGKRMTCRWLFLFNFKQAEAAGRGIFLQQDLIVSNTEFQKQAARDRDYLQTTSEIFQLYVQLVFSAFLIFGQNPNQRFNQKRTQAIAHYNEIITNRKCWRQRN
jgi:hypothetical protein